MNEINVNTIEKYTQLAVTSGLGIVLSIILVIAFIYFGWWVLRTNNKREEKLAEIVNISLKALSESVNNHAGAMRDLGNMISRDNEALKQAATFQRAEHKEMIDLLQTCQKR